MALDWCPCHCVEEGMGNWYCCTDPWYPCAPETPADTTGKTRVKGARGPKLTYRPEKTRGSYMNYSDVSSPDSDRFENMSGCGLWMCDQ